MEIKFWLNGKKIQEEIQPDMLLLDLLRAKGCYSVKRGCETANCGLCTVLLEENQCCPVVFWLPEQMENMW